MCIESKEDANAYNANARNVAMAGNGDGKVHGKSSKIGCHCFEENKGCPLAKLFSIVISVFNITLSIRKNEDQVKKCTVLGLKGALKPPPPEGTNSDLFYNHFHNVMTNNAIREKQNNDKRGLDNQIQDSASQSALDLIGDPNIASDPTIRRELSKHISQKAFVQVRNQDGTYSH